MDPLLQKNLITTKSASELSGYTSDYLSRLIRSGKISGQKVGHSWLINSESLDAFINAQKNHNIDRARELATTRAKEYQYQQKLAVRIRRDLTKAVVVPEGIIGPVPFASHALALSIACAVVVGGAALAQAAATQQLAERGVVLAMSTVHGFAETYGEVPLAMTANYERVKQEIAARPMAVAERMLHATQNITVPDISQPDLSFIVMKTECVSDSCARPSYMMARAESAVGRKVAVSIAIGPLLSEVTALTASPAYARGQIVRGFTYLGTGAYAGIGTVLSLYRSAIESAGRSAFELAVMTRDSLRTAPRSVALVAHSFVDLTHAIIRADVSGAYGMAALAPASARIAVTAFGNVGSALASATAQVPGATAQAYLGLAAGTAHLAPALANAVFGAEYRGALAFVGATNTVTENYLTLLIQSGSLVYSGAERARTATSAGAPWFAQATSGMSDGYAYLSDSVAATLSSLAGTHPLAGALAAAQPPLSLGGEVALATYQTIHSWYESMTNRIALMFSPFPTVVLVSSKAPVKGVAVATSSAPLPVSKTAPTSSRAPNIYPTYTTVVQGVSSSVLDTSLLALKNDVLGTVAGMIRPVAAQGVTNMQTIQYVNMIQDLSNLIVRNGDFRGGTLTGGVSVSATTGNFTNLIAGGVDIAGSLAAGTVSSNAYVSSPYFTATSATSTSTFAGSLGIGTTSPYRTLSVVGSGVFTGGDVLASTFTATSSISTPSFTLSGASINSLLSTNANGLVVATSTPTFGNFNATSTIATSTISTGGLAIGTNQLVVQQTSGNVGIGTTTPDALLALQQTVNGTPFISAYRATDSAPAGDFINFRTKAGTPLFRVDNSGNLLAGGIINTGSQTITSTSSPQFRVQYDPSNEITTSVSSTGATTFGINGSAPSLTFTSGSNRVNAFNFTNALGANSILSIDTLNQRVGIGTTNPNYKLEVNGSASTTLLYLPQTTDSTIGVIYSGASRFIHAYKPIANDGQNTFIGLNAGNFTMGSTTGAAYLGSYNTALGQSTLSSNTTGSYNTAAGVNALTANTTGGYNTALGENALLNNTIGYINTATGANALITNTTGYNNTATGVNALFSNTTGSNNTAIGYQAGYGDGTANMQSNIDIGATFLGSQASRDASVATSTFLINATAVGYNAKVAASNSLVLGGTGASAVNVGIGTTTPGSLLTVFKNATAFQTISIESNASNDIFGYRLLSYSPGGRDWRLEEGRAGTGSFGISDMTAGQTRLAIDANGSVGIGTTSPWAQLSVNPNGVTGPAFVVGSSTATNFIVTNGGNVGIGTTTPYAQLSISNSATTPVNGTLFVIASTTGGISTTTLMTVLANGNVGIGTAAPSTGLDVETTAFFNSNAAVQGNGFRNLITLGNTANHKSQSNQGAPVTLEDNMFNTGGNTTAFAINSYQVGTPGTGLAQLELNRSSANAIAHSAVAAGQNLGIISFGGSDGADFKSAATIMAQVNGTVSSGVVPGDLLFSTVAPNGTLNERMRITSSGNVGIGTTSPIYKLDVYGTSASIAHFISPVATTNRTLFEAPAGQRVELHQVLTGAQDWVTGVDGGDSNKFKIAAADDGFASARLTMTIGGNVGIGTTSPLSKLHVYGSTGGSIIAHDIAAGNVGYDSYMVAGVLKGVVQWNTSDVGAVGTGMIVQNTQGKLNLWDSTSGGISITSGNVGIGTTSPGSLLSIGGQGTGWNFFDNGTTTSYAKGIDLKNGGCFAINGTCVTGGGATLSGTTGQVAYFSGTNTAVGTSTLFISSAGNVGVGTNNPGAKLDIAGGDVRLTTSGAQFIYAGTAGTVQSGLLFDAGNIKMGFYTNGTQKAVIDSVGNVGIGTTSPSSILAISNSATTAANTPLFSIASTTGGTSASTLMTVLANGNVGIGTANPLASLAVDQGSYPVGLRLQRAQATGAPNLQFSDIVTHANYISMSTSTGQLFFGSTASAGTNGQMTIDTSGNVGIGTTSPLAKLAVTNSANYAGVEVSGANGANTGMFRSSYNADPGYYREFGRNNSSGAFEIRRAQGGAATADLTIDVSGNVGIGTTSPHQTLDVNGLIGTTWGTTFNTYFNGSWTNTGVGYAGAMQFEPSTGKYYFWTSAASAAAGVTNPLSTSTMTMTPTGNVGIGTTTPRSILNLQGSNGGATALTVNSGNGHNWQLGTGVGNLGSADYFGIYEATSNVTPFVINTSGQIGIGTTNPTAGKLDVETSSDSVAGYFFNASGATSPALKVFKNSAAGSTDPAFSIFNGNAGGTEVFRVQAGGNVGIGTTSPTAKLDVVGSTRSTSLYASGLDATGITGQQMRMAVSAGIGYLQSYDFTAGAYQPLAIIGATTTITASNDVVLNAGGGERMHITSAGNIGIGTTSPVSKLSVVGESAFAGGATVGLGYAGTAAPANGMIVQGNVGIGTTSPQKKLHVNSATESSMLFTSDLTGSASTDGLLVALNANGTDSTLWNFENGYMRFATNNTERMRIDSTGNVGIGTTAPASKLSISGGNISLGVFNTQGASTAKYIGVAGTADAWGGGSGSTNVGFFTDSDNASGHLEFSTHHSGISSGVRMLIDRDGNVGIGTTSPDMLLSVGSATPVGNVAHFENSTGSCYINPTTTALVCSSDARLKYNLNAISTTTALADVLALSPTYFNWNAEPLGTPEHAGLIAQKVQSIFPDLVAQQPDGYLTMNYAGLTPYLTAAVQGLAANLRQIEPIAGVLSVGPDVNAQCVVGETRLRRRRRRADGSWEYDEVDLVHISAGDDIQSLEERTGRVVYSRVNGLVDMGEQEVYELVTKSGRRIRTTANHPFLARERSAKA